jgi:hypothetical protein
MRGSIRLQANGRLVVCAVVVACVLLRLRSSAGGRLVYQENSLVEAAPVSCGFLGATSLSRCQNCVPGSLLAPRKPAPAEDYLRRWMSMADTGAELGAAALVGVVVPARRRPGSNGQLRWARSRARR